MSGKSVFACTSKQALSVNPIRSCSIRTPEEYFILSVLTLHSKHNAKIDCLCRLIQRGRSFDKKSGYCNVHMNINGDVVAFDAFGTEINRNTVYSAALRKLVIRCLARKATYRPRPDEILAICEGATAVVSSLENGEPTIGGRTAMQFWDPKWEKKYGL